jgi:hypothetical protein
VRRRPETSVTSLSHLQSPLTLSTRAHAATMASRQSRRGSSVDLGSPRGTRSPSVKPRGAGGASPKAKATLSPVPIPSPSSPSSSSRGVITLTALPSNPPPLPPHLVKNPFIRSGYVVHQGPADALLDALTFRGLTGFVHNETGNVMTGLLMLGVAAYALNASLDPALLPSHALALRILALAEAWNAVCVVLYHSLLSVPRLYHAVSALDLLGISLLQLGVVATHGIDGASSWALAHPDPPPSSSWAPGLLFGLLHPSEATVAHVSVIVAAALVTCSTRVLIQRESPFALIAANAGYYFVLIPDYVAARWGAADGDAHLAPAVFAILLAGATLYALKIPERVYPGRFDLVGHSHFLWHCAYVTAFALYTWDVVGLAGRAAGEAAARAAAEAAAAAAAAAAAGAATAGAAAGAASGGGWSLFG